MTSLSKHPRCHNAEVQQEGNYTDPLKLVVKHLASFSLGVNKSGWYTEQLALAELQRLWWSGRASLAPQSPL